MVENPGVLVADSTTLQRVEVFGKMLPVVGSIWDGYDDWYAGNWWGVGFNAAMLGLDLRTGYGGTMLRAVRKARTLLLAKELTNFSRELKAADLGLKGTVEELRGTFAVKDGIATMRVDMIRGEIQNPLAVVSNMVEAAKANGATTLRIEGTIANERLYDVLQRRYGLTSSGATDVLTIPLR
jgi:hypothetical protein